MTYTLFYAPGACSLTPHVVLLESGLPFRLSRVEFGDAGKRTHGDERADFLALNPGGYVPALALPDGALLTETGVMIQYLADQVPEKKLAPAIGTFERVRFAETVSFIATELHKAMSPLYNPKLGDEYKAMLIDRLGKRYAILGERVAKTRYSFGESFTVADAYALFVLRAWKRNVKTPLPGAHLADYYTRLLERPSVTAMIAAEKIEV